MWVKAPGRYSESRRQEGGRVRARDFLGSNMGARATLRHEHALAGAALALHV